MFLLSSDYEGLSNSMIEALALGAPTISTDCLVGGARMMIENEVNGLLVPVGDEQAIANAMTLIADDKKTATRLSVNGIKIRERLSVSTICPQWEALL